MDSIPRTSGIYKITCMVNGKIYVGSSNNLRKRWKNHTKSLQQNTHHNQYLQRGWNKYGADAFVFEVIELVMPWALLDREQYWLDTLKPFSPKGFNISLTANAGMGGRKHSIEARTKMSGAKKGKSLSEKHRSKISKSIQGIKRTPEEIAKTVATRRRNGTYTHSQESRAKISASGLGRKHTTETRMKISATQRKQYVVISPEGEILNISGLKPFCREKGLSCGAMTEVAQGKRQHYKGWKCRYD